MKYTEGEQVLAKHPLLLGYHRGTVLDVKGDRCVIKFDTGGEHMVNEDDVQVIRLKIIVSVSNDGNNYHKRRKSVS